MAGPDESAAEASESDPAEPDASETEEQLRDQRLQRLAKLDALRAEGVDPYPVRFDADVTSGALRAEYGDLEPGTETERVVRLAGRILLLRRQGKLSFATVQDRDGTIQLFVNQRTIGEEAHEAFDRLDRGDWIGVTGTVMTTKRGELSIGVQEFRLLSKALRPLPEKWHGLSDVDTRYRQRYVDLVVNEDARRIALARIEILAALRAHLIASGYREVEGPVLQTIQGGATAQSVHHAPQRARPGHVPAHRARAPPQAAHRRRAGPRVRDRAGVPQRGRGHHAQPRVHDARGVPRVR